MPHLKVSPFSHDTIDAKLSESRLMTFRAKALTGEDEIIGVVHDGEEFLLQLKPDLKSTLLKYDKVTRPLKVNLLKEALEMVSTELALEIQSSNTARSNSKPPLASAYFKKIEDFETIIYPKEKISIEVGFGSGRHLLWQAQQHPDTLFIGLEIHTPSAQQVLRQIELQGLDNIWIVNYDARLFLEMLPSNRCERIFVHFPVPWDKKPHRRVISSTFLLESMRVLGKEGRLELRTDSDNYFWYALETFFSVPKTEVEVRKNEALEITSKYEARWRKQEKDIYDVYVTCREDSPQKEIEINFGFTDVKYREGLERRLPKEAMVAEEYFIHFERSYKVGNEALLLKCAFGSFDRPEHKYIFIGKEKSRYFASTPVKTTVNDVAHKKIVALLSEKENYVECH